MAEIQTRANQRVTDPILAVVGNRLPLKLVPGRGETIPATLAVAPAHVAVIEEISHRPQQNFSTFTLHALAPGRATLTVQSGGRAIAGPIGIRVDATIALPAAGTDAGLLARLFLAECPGPGTAGATDAAITEVMTLMRVVLQNRLAQPSGRWGSAGATGLADVVRSRGQFEGFGGYPTLSTAVSGRIAEFVRIANDAADRRQPAMRAHVARAIAVASGPRPTDPTNTGLYWWRTQNSGAPGTGVTVYKSLLGNTFYREGTR